MSNPINEQNERNLAQLRHLTGQLRQISGRADYEIVAIVDDKNKKGEHSYVLARAACDDDGNLINDEGGATLDAVSHRLLFEAMVYYLDAFADGHLEAKAKPLPQRNEVKAENVESKPSHSLKVKITGECEAAVQTGLGYVSGSLHAGLAQGVGKSNGMTYPYICEMPEAEATSKANALGLKASQIQPLANAFYEQCRADAKVGSDD